MWVSVTNTLFSLFVIRPNSVIDTGFFRERDKLAIFINVNIYALHTDSLCGCVYKQQFSQLTLICP